MMSYSQPSDLVDQTLNDMPETSRKKGRWVISYLAPFHVFQPTSIFICHLLFFPFPFLSLSVDSCIERLHRLWSLAEGRQLSFGSGMERDKGSVGWLPPSVFLPIRAPWADCPLFHNSISRDHAAKQWKIHYTMFPHQRCLLFDLHLSCSDSHEYGRWIRANIWGYAKFNKRRACQAWNRLYRGSMDKFGLVGGTFIPGKFLDLYFMF